MRSYLRAWGTAATLGFACGCSLDASGFGGGGPPTPVGPSGTGTSTGTPEDPSTGTTAPEAVDSSTSGRPNDSTTSSTGEPLPGDDSTTAASDTDGPKVLELCTMPNAPIPDNDANGVSSAVEVTVPGSIVDVRVELQITHEFIGDLRVALLGNAGQVAIVDRPDDADYRTDGNCGGLNIDAVLHDAAATTVDEVCFDGANPGLVGEVRPDMPLGPVFAGTPTEGGWRLLVVDAANYDVGTLESWCLHITYE